MTKFIPTPDEYLAQLDNSIAKQVIKHGPEVLDGYPKHMVYLETCFVVVTNSGLVIMSLTPDGDDEPMPQLYRHELPMGQLGDEMWERLTTGLRLRQI